MSLVIHHISNVSVSYGKNQALKIGSSVADSYIAETSYKAYLFVNTGHAETTLEANDYTVLVINNPTSDLTDLEYEDLQAYLDDGGRLMLNLSVAYPDTMENFNRLLARYGVTVTGWPFLWHSSTCSMTARYLPFTVL